MKEAAVVGVPDPRKGEHPIAFVVAKDGETVDEKGLVRFLKGKIADYKLPRRVLPLSALPRNATGKVLKTSLRDMTAQGGHAA